MTVIVNSIIIILALLISFFLIKQYLLNDRKDKLYHYLIILGLIFYGLAIMQQKTLNQIDNRNKHTNKEFISVLKKYILSEKKENFWEILKNAECSSEQRNVAYLVLNHLDDNNKDIFYQKGGMVSLEELNLLDNNKELDLESKNIDVSGVIKILKQDFNGFFTDKESYLSKEKQKLANKQLILLYVSIFLIAVTLMSWIIFWKKNTFSSLKKVFEEKRINFPLLDMIAIPCMVFACFLNISLCFPLILVWLVLPFGCFSSKKRKILAISRIRLPRLKEFFNSISCYIVLISVVMLLYFLLTPLLKEIPGKHPITNSTIMQMIILAVIIAPIIEEFIFRVFIFRYLQQYMTSFAACIIQSVIFAVVHPQGLAAFVFLCAIGFIFSFIYLKYRSILLSVFLHGINNAIVLTVTLLNL